MNVGGRVAALISLLGLWAGCPSTSTDTGTTAPAEPSDPAPAPGSSTGGGPAPSGGVLQVNAGEAAPVQIRFTTVGPLHQGFFGKSSAVRQLGEGLGSCTDHAVDVDVVWSQKDLEGRIIASVPPESSVCAPTLTDGVVDLTPLVPTTRAVARYRDTVAGFSDFRIANFVVAADIQRQGTICRIRAAGQHPPDGTRFHPCVEVNGERVCAAGSPAEGVVRLAFDDDAARRKVARCFR